MESREKNINKVTKIINKMTYTFRGTDLTVENSYLSVQLLLL